VVEIGYLIVVFFMMTQNMVAAEEADDPNLMNEIYEEAKKFGKVEETHLHRVGNPRTKKVGCLKGCTF